MPQKHGAQVSKRQKTSMANQKKQLDIAIDDTDAFFGRIVKINMGRCTVNIWDHELHPPRHVEVQARLPNKKKGFIKMNDLVNIAKSHPDWEVQIALDAKAANQLRKAGRISAELATETSGHGGGAPSTEELGIEFDYEGIDTSKAVEDALVPLKLKESRPDQDFDIDAI